MRGPSEAAPLLVESSSYENMNLNQLQNGAAAGNYWGSNINSKQVVPSAAPSCCGDHGAPCASSPLGTCTCRRLPQQQQQQQRQHERRPDQVPSHISVPAPPRGIVSTGACRTTSTTTSGTVNNNNNNTRNQLHVHVGLELLSRQEQFLAFVKILLKHLEKSDEVLLHRRCKAILADCLKNNRQGNPEFIPLHEAAEARLLPAVGPRHWNRAVQYLNLYLKQLHQQQLLQMGITTTTSTTCNSNSNTLPPQQPPQEEDEDDEGDDDEEDYDDDDDEEEEIEVFAI